MLSVAALSVAARPPLRNSDDSTGRNGPQVAGKGYEGLVDEYISAQPSGASVHVWPNAVRVRYKGWQSKLPYDRAPRGLIYGLSDHARRRLKETTARIDFHAHQACLVTLTWHWCATDDPRVWHSALHRLEQELQRKYGGRIVGGLWALEFQKRGAPHFHLLLTFAKPVDISRLRHWTSQVWNRIAEPGDSQHLAAGTNVTPCRLHAKGGVRKLLGYLAKYLAKPEQKRHLDRETGEVLPTGRMWGTFGDLPLEAGVFFDLTPDGIREYERRVREAYRESPYLSNFGIGYLGGLIYGEAWEAFGLLSGLIDAGDLLEAASRCRSP